jgi:hypothetical protein
MALIFFTIYRIKKYFGKKFISLFKILNIYNIINNKIDLNYFTVLKKIFFIF